MITIGSRIDQKKIISQLKENQKTKTELSKLTEIPLHLIPTSLLELELQGVIESKAGGIYTLT